MIALTANLIVPAPDVLPVPAPTPVMHLLLLLTFLLHLLAMNAMLGGLLIALVTAFRDRASTLPATVVKSTPTLVASTVTLGVAPLLFLQTLMGQFFFTSSILMGWGWFSVVVVLILAYYGAYLQAFRWAKRGTVQVGVLLATVLGFLWIAFMFSNNTSLMAAPAVWGDKYFADPRGLHLNLTDATLWPRYLHAVLGAAAVAGLVLGWWGSRRADAQAGAAMHRTGLKTFTLVTAVNVLAGLWYLMALPREAMLLFMGRSALGTGLLTAGLVLSLAALYLGWRAWKRGPGAGLVPLTLVVLVVMAVMVVMRDVARGGLLAGLYTPEAFPVAPQWLNMGIFTVLLLGGIAVTVWMVRRLAAAWGNQA